MRVSPGGGHGNPLQYFCLKNPLDRRVGYSPSGRKELDMTKQLSMHAGCRYSHSEGFHGSPSAFSLPESVGKVTASKPFPLQSVALGCHLVRLSYREWSDIIFSGTLWNWSLWWESQRCSEMTQWNGGEGRRGLQRDRRYRLKQRESDSRRKRKVHLMKIRPPGDLPDGLVAKTLGPQCRSAQERSLVRELDPVCCS